MFWFLWGEHRKGDTFMHLHHKIPEFRRIFTGFKLTEKIAQMKRLHVNNFEWLLARKGHKQANRPLAALADKLSSWSYPEFSDRPFFHFCCVLNCTSQPKSPPKTPWEICTQVQVQPFDLLLPIQKICLLSWISLSYRECELFHGQEGNMAERSFPGQVLLWSHLHHHIHFVSCKVHLFQIRRIHEMFL